MAHGNCFASNGDVLRFNRVLTENYKIDLDVSKTTTTTTTRTSVSTNAKDRKRNVHLCI